METAMKKHPSAVLMLAAVAILALAAVAWLTVVVPAAQAAGDPIVVIVNAANPVADLSMSDLKKLFLSDRSRWNTGTAVAPVMVGPGAPERTAFLKIVCAMNDAEFNKYFLQSAFSGGSAIPPKVVGSSQDVKGFVASSPGAIGFVKAGDFHGDGSDGGVKAVKVDGVSAADAGYKLRM
jgi:ABC-type phosphate transport system substrate-binding protein